MSDYPRLTEMGIQHPKQITGFVINSLNQVDTLRISYEREKGSLLPVSRSYEFPRVQVNKQPDPKAGTILSTSPILKEIEAELDRLMTENDCTQTVAECMREELEALENEFNMRTAYLRERLEQLESK